LEHNLENGIIRIEPSDWRWSASIVGLSKYFDFYNIKYTVEDEYIEFDKNEIIREKYLKFVEGHFMDKMHHKVIEELLEIENPTDEQIKLVNEKLKNKQNSSNTIIKKNLGHFDYDGSNKREILELISEKRLEIIENTYINGKALYANFCNKGNFLEEKGSICRIIGYYVDKGRKIKALSFGRDENNFVYNDSIYFDFIPFGFSKTREAFFINNNFTVDQLIKTNKVDLLVDENLNISNLLYRVKDSANYIDYDVEVIKKDREKDYYETVYIRKTSIDILKNIDEKTQEAIKFDIKVKNIIGEVRQEKKDNKIVNKREKIGNNWYYWLKIEKIITNSILNNLKIDYLIEKLFIENLDETNLLNYKISHLIKINQLIYEGGKDMTLKQKKAYDAAVAVKKALSGKSNKIRSYEQRLISSISLREYEKVQEILLHLSAYTQVEMGFLIDIFKDFEGNKNLVYTFINTLGEKKTNSETKTEGEDKK